MTETPDTIFAVASGAGKSAVAVVRLSGPDVRFALETMTGSIPQARRASLRAIRAELGGPVLDRGLVLWFPAPGSFTGEDCAEFQLHGGRAIVAAVLQGLGSLPGLRAAEAGEFTRRAFLNGRLDLSQVEGLADLIDSETELQRAQALRQFERGLSGPVETWRSALVSASALIEAEIDFTDESDVPASTHALVRGILAPVAKQIDEAIRRSGSAEALREGYCVMIAGPPNAGKSSLMNWIARREVAIVSEHAGTTRDLIEIPLDIGGVPISLVDSAGIRETTNPVEREGVERAMKRARGASLVLWLSDSDCTIPADFALPAKVAVLKIRTKSDLDGNFDGHFDFAISVFDGQGIDGLLQAISGIAIHDLPAAGTAALTRTRHRIACQTASDALQRVIGVKADHDVVLIAEDLRLAIRALGSLIGKVDVEELLGEIFSRFCIGK